MNLEAVLIVVGMSVVFGLAFLAVWAMMCLSVAAGLYKAIFIRPKMHTVFYIGVMLFYMLVAYAAQVMFWLFLTVILAPAVLIPMPDMVSAICMVAAIAYFIWTMYRMEVKKVEPRWMPAFVKNGFQTILDNLYHRNVAKECTH